MASDQLERDRESSTAMATFALALATTAENRGRLVRAQSPESPDTVKVSASQEKSDMT